MQSHSAPLDAADEPEAVVRGFLADLDAGRGAAARARLAADYVLEVVGQGNWPIGGEHRGADLSALMRTVRHRFPVGLVLMPGAVTARGDRVIVEARSQGVRRDGRDYRNEYVFIFVVEGGLIRRQREFCDIIAADEILCGPLGADDIGACQPRPGKGALEQDH